RRFDTYGNDLTYSYTGDELTRVTTATGEFVQYRWLDGRVDRIEVRFYASEADKDAQILTETTRTYYKYDDHGRLHKVFTDLTPDDNNVSDLDRFETIYEYVGSTNRIARITQSDGAKAEFDYDASGRIEEVRQFVSDTDIRVTQYAYHTGYTEITDPRGAVTQIHFDAQSRLTQIVSPEPSPGAGSQTTQIEYHDTPSVDDDWARKVIITRPDGTQIENQYDENGNLFRMIDPEGIV
ncbi:hypothetical protein RMQ97_15455, partial [Maricaulis sp. D1M11]|uniref:hypothetical protein n=1 Tax=Maricaulis sp. D1M11 TaxID=3076117 RepID=UPI0039B3A2C7